MLKVRFFYVMEDFKAPRHNRIYVLKYHGPHEIPRITQEFENELLMPDVVKLFFGLVVVFATVLCSNAKRPNTARATTVPVLEFALTSEKKKKLESHLRKRHKSTRLFTDSSIASNSIWKCVLPLHI